MPNCLKAILKLGLLTSIVLLLCTQSPLTAQILDDQWARANAAYLSGLYATQSCNRWQYDVAMEKLKHVKDTANGEVNSLNDHARRQWMALNNMMGGLSNLIDADVSGQLRSTANAIGGAIVGVIPFGGSASSITQFLADTADRLERAGAQQDILNLAREQMNEIQTTYQQIEGWKGLADEVARMEQRLINNWFRNCSDGGEPGPTGAGPGVTPDGGEWCTYWGWTPEEVPTPTTPEKVPTPTTTGEVPTPTTTGEVPTPTTPEEVPTPIIKATVTDPNTGQPVTGCRLALTSPPPDLPGTRARDDSGYNEDSTQATTGPDGTATLVAGGNPPEFQDGGELTGTPVEVEIDLPSFRSYIAKIKVDRNKPAWDNPARYLDPDISYFVARKWIVGDSMFVVINVPTIKEK